MAVSEILRMYAKDGLGDQLQEAVDQGLHLFLDDPGCAKVQVFRQVDDPSCFVLIAEWESDDAHKQWAASPALPEWRGLIGELRDDRTQPLGDYSLVFERR